jgi:hypothetical protein
MTCFIKQIAQDISRTLRKKVVKKQNKTSSRVFRGYFDRQLVLKATSGSPETGRLI